MTNRSKSSILKIVACIIAVIIVISITSVYITYSDWDGDDLAYWKERDLKTDPLNPDTDKDGLKDGEEVLKYSTNPLDPDTDKDGLKDLDEVSLTLTDPLNLDTDGDRLKDGEEALTYRTDPSNPDTDKDGLSDLIEVLKYIYSTDPLNPDTDKDGLKDGEEALTYRTDPSNADTDKDGLKDGEEVLKYSTNPLDPDTDKDGLKDGEDFWPLFDLKLNVTIVYWKELVSRDSGFAGDPYFVIEVLYYPDELSPSRKIRSSSSTFIDLGIGENITSIIIDVPDHFYICFIYVYAYDNDTWEGGTYDEMYYLNSTTYLGEIQRLVYLKLELDKRVDIEKVILLSNKDRPEIDAEIEVMISFIKIT